MKYTDVNIPILKFGISTIINCRTWRLVYANLPRSEPDEAEDIKALT